MTRSLLLALPAAVVLGAAGRASDYGSDELSFAFALGAPWVLVAFGVGASAPRIRQGAVAGAVALAASVAVYYAIRVGVEQRSSAGYGVAMTVLWGALGVGCGGLFGAAGAAARGRDERLRIAAAALLGGTLAGEALLFLAVGRPQTTVLAFELALGCAAAIAIAGPARTWPRLVPATAAAAGIALFAAGALRLLARMGGWGGA